MRVHEDHPVEAIPHDRVFRICLSYRDFPYKSLFGFWNRCPQIHGPPISLRLHRNVHKIIIECFKLKSKPGFELK